MTGLDPNVTILIDGLPITSERQNQAKSILCAKYGRPRKVVKAHIQCIMQLPTINGTNSQKINEFHENLITHVHTLNLMERLQNISRYVRFTFDKFAAIRGGPA